ncbi:MAG TPA: J domain-containing protein, partial [Aggregatilineales bacterium]|nr:J domain-containing protein [Aggregatilineales bacterium]
DREPYSAAPAPGTIAAEYAVLGITPGAGVDEVRRAYRDLARQFHPDLNNSTDATTRMQAINAAYARVMAQFGEDLDL